MFGKKCESASNKLQSALCMFRVAGIPHLMYTSVFVVCTLYSSACCAFFSLSCKFHENNCSDVISNDSRQYPNEIQNGSTLSIVIGTYLCQPMKHEYSCLELGRAVNISVTRPGRKQATMAKLGIYSPYSPRSSVHFLAHYCNICKPLKKKIQIIVRPTTSPRQQ